MVNRLLGRYARQIWPIIIIAFFKELNWSSFTFLKMMMTNVRSCFGWNFSCPLKPIESRSFTDMTLSDKDSHLHNFGERRPKVGVTSMSAMLPLLHCRADRSTRVKSRLRAQLRCSWRASYTRQLRAVKSSSEKQPTLKPRSTPRASSSHHRAQGAYPGFVTIVQFSQEL